MGIQSSRQRLLQHGARAAIDVRRTAGVEGRPEQRLYDEVGVAVEKSRATVDAIIRDPDLFRVSRSFRDPRCRLSRRSVPARFRPGSSQSSQKTSTNLQDQRKDRTRRTYREVEKGRTCLSVFAASVRRASIQLHLTRTRIFRDARGSCICALMTLQCSDQPGGTLQRPS